MLDWSNEEVVHQVSRIDSAGNQIYRDFKNKSLIIRYSTNPDYLKPFNIQDVWEDMNWSIGSENKRIKGFECSRATASYRGRIYIAWFTKEIEVPYGPWKLHGLPGLIIEAYDEDKLVHFRFRKFCKDKEEVMIRTPKEEVTKDLKEFVNFKDSLGYHLFTGMQKKVFGYNEKYQKSLEIMFRYKPTKSKMQRREEWLERVFPWQKQSPYRKPEIEDQPEIKN